MILSSGARCGTPVLAWALAFASLRDTLPLRGPSYGTVVGAAAAADTINLFTRNDDKGTKNSGKKNPGKNKVKWTDDDGGGGDEPLVPPHLGCSAFLKTNHDVQKLDAVNFKDKKSKSDGGKEGDDFAAAASAPVACSGGVADTGTTQYPCSNIDLYSFLPLEVLGQFTPGEGNDIWGWTHAPSGREFAIMGLTSGASFVEVTDPLNPLYVGFLPTATTCSNWRDVKTYGDYAFVVSEASGHGMQGFDMTLLLDVAEADMPTLLAPTSYYTGFGNAHNIVINEDSGFAYAVGTNTFSGGLHIVDVSDPSNPVAAGGFSGDGYTHDAQCVIYNGPDSRFTGSEICFNYNEDTLTIVDVTTKSNPTELSRLGYSGSDYTHQGWLTEDWRYAIVNDELDESGGASATKTHVFNVELLDDPSYIGAHDGTTPAIDHNLYIIGNLVFEANYRAGLQVLRLDDPSTASMTQVAHFDIYPGSDSANFNGAWSNYPYFPSGTVVVSGIEQGLFVLRSPNNFGTSARVRRREVAVPIQKEPTVDEKRRSLQDAGCTVQDFEAASPGGTDGWTTGGDCSTGAFVVGTPSQVIENCLVTQPGGDHTTGSGQALYTAPNTNAGTDDVDGGECSAVSPSYSVAVDSELSAWYYFGQRDTGDDAGDYFALEASVDGGAWQTMSSIGDVTWQAVWSEAAFSVPAGSSVRLRVRASDGAATGDIVEAGIDDIVICPTGTASPTTRTPTGSPTLPAPTNSPTTAAPTVSPTPAPTDAPTPPIIQASFDGTAPRCTAVGRGCVSGTLLNSRGAMGTAEPNNPNTIDGCSDGNSGSYHSDESIDAIEVSAAGGGILRVGGQATITATVWAWNDGSADTADFYVADGDSNPSWTFLGSVPAGGGSQRSLESPPFTLTSTLMTARVRFRYNGSASPCSNGNYDDADDLIFAVASATPATPEPTGSPTTTSPTPAPTPEPTNDPTSEPTSSPTMSPTTAPPTLSPTTPAPTPNPTNFPEPTANPTNAPITPNPTPNPTSQPTPNPTAPAPITPAPTDAPTAAPTSAPTDAPTAAPTSPPTHEPTQAPNEMTDAPTFFSCAQFNEVSCPNAYGGGQCQWVGSCHNCGCVPTPRQS